MLGIAMACTWVLLACYSLLSPRELQHLAGRLALQSGCRFIAHRLRQSKYDVLWAAIRSSAILTPFYARPWHRNVVGIKVGVAASLVAENV